MGVADARAAASEAIEALERGADPSGAKQRAKADRRQAELTERDKIKTLVAHYGKRHLSTLKSARRSSGNLTATWSRCGASAIFKILPSAT